MNSQEELFSFGLNEDQELLNKIWINTSRINLKLHNRYTDTDWKNTQAELRKCLKIADRKYKALKLDSIDYPNERAYEKISELYNEINVLQRNGSELVGEDRLKCRNKFKELFKQYSELIYSFQTARRETKNIRDIEVTADKIGMILLCKNVRIMEDLINKICSNNIDKSIIGGDKHFESMRYGFEWLFCHNDVSRSDSYMRIDIRDRNRYLDYIKYQIMVTGQYVDGAPKSSTEIDQYYLHIEDAFDRESFENKAEKIKKFKKEVTQLIEEFFDIYELLIKYRDALFREEEIRKELSGADKVENEAEENITVNIINLSSVAVRVLLDRFVSFVKINDLNFGNSTFNRSWFNYSELSSSNYAGSNFKYARIENAKVKNCDISTCNLSMADGGHTDFSHSNFNYSNLTGINLIDATVNYCEFQNAIFRDANIDSYQDAVKDSWGTDLRGDSKARELISIWRSLGDGNEPLKDIINAYTKLKSTDLEISADKASWTILKYEFKNDDRRVIIQGIRQLVTQYLEKHISAELLHLVKKRFSWEDKEAKTARIRKYGKVLLEVANLNNISAKCTQMSNSDLCHVMMQNSSFEDADLSGASLHYTNAQYASFIKSNGNKIDCFESNFYYANFSNVIMNNALFLNCNLNRTNWDRSIIISSIFVDFSPYVASIIEQQTMEEISLQIDQCFKFEEDPKNQRVVTDCPMYQYTPAIGDEVTFWQANCSISDATFTNVLADNTVFLDILADRSSFDYSSFKNALFANCKMYLSDFVEVDLRYANFTLCCMGQSNFNNANITGAKLCNVDFSNCNMSGSLLNLSELNHVLFDDSDLQTMNLSGSQVNNSAFINCKFNRIILAGARFRNCIFSFIDFNNLIGVHSAIFDNCYTQHCTYKGKAIDTGKLDEGIFYADV